MIVIDYIFRLRLFEYTTYILCLFPLLPQGIRTAVFMIWSLFGFINFRNFKKRQEFNSIDKKKHIRLLLISIAPFLILLISLSYSENFSRGLHDINKMILLLFIPIVFFLNKNYFNKRKLNICLAIFSFSVVVLVSYQILISIIHIDDLVAPLSHEEKRVNNLLKMDVLDNEIVNRIKLRRFRNFILSSVDTHFTYQGLWISLVVFWLASNRNIGFKSKNWNIAVSYIIIFILLLWLLVLSAKMPLISILITTLLILPTFYEIKLRSFVFFLLISSGLFASGYFFVKPFQIRINEIFITGKTLPTKGTDIQTYNSINVRNGIMYCSLKIIKKHLVYGVGIGDSQDMLDHCYQKDLKAKIYTWKKYNAHNQYFHFIISSGLFGFFAFLHLIFWHYHSAISFGNSYHFFFITSVVIISLTECILLRSDGILFFAMFGNLFLFNRKKQL